MREPGRRGLRGRPPGGWPLDRILVGVAALRTTRELFHLQERFDHEPLRAWDLALWGGISPQAARRALQRMEELGLVRVEPPSRAGRARRHGLVRDHALAAPLARLFEAERHLVPRPRPFARARRDDRR